MEWSHRQFGKWLRYQRTIEHEMSQDRLAETLGVPQAYISRWERGWEQYPNTEPPELDVILELADLFEVNFIELAKLCGRWNDRLEKRVLIDVAKMEHDELSDAPVAQLDRAADF